MPRTSKQVGGLNRYLLSPFCNLPFHVNMAKSLFIGNGNCFAVPGHHPAIQLCQGRTRRLKFQEAWQLALSGGWDGSFTATCDVGWATDSLQLRLDVQTPTPFNNFQDGELWRGDSMELFLAGPCGAPLTYGKSSFPLAHLVMAPPQEGSDLPQWHAFTPVPCPDEWVRLAFKSTPKGYALDLTLLSHFLGDEEWREGREFALQIRLNHLSGAGRLQIFNLGGVDLMSNHAPASYFPVRLTTEEESAERCLDADWRSHATFAAHRVTISAAPLGDSLTASILGKDGTVLLQAALPPEGGDLEGTDDLGADACALVLQPTAQGVPLGIRALPVVVLEGCSDFLAGLDERLTTGQLQARLAFASAVDFLNTTVCLPGDELSKALLEVRCRLAILQGRALPSEATPLLRLLELTRLAPEGLAVEYPKGRLTRKAQITLFSGSLPFGYARCNGFASAEEAVAFLRRQRRLFPEVTEGPMDEGDESLLATGIPAESGMLYTDYEPSRDVCLLFQDNLYDCVRLRLHEALELSPDAVAVQPDAPGEVAAAVRAFGAKQGIPEISFADCKDYGMTLCAGTPPPGSVSAGHCPEYHYRTTLLFVRQGSLVYSVCAPPAELAMGFARLLLAGRPITEQQIEELRSLRAADLCKKFAPAMPPAPLWVGDPHTHTIYSDGCVKPTTLLLSAASVGLDFVAITDHNGVIGALDAQRACREAGWNYQFTVGEELTMNNRFHLNFYPLTEYFEINRPFQELESEAHRIGAIVQWNHPTTYGKAFNRYWFPPAAPTECPGVDAIERNLEFFDEWQRCGRLPVFVGSTDCHHGIFGQLDKTVICAERRDGSALAQAIRTRQAAMIAPQLPELVYGDPGMRSYVSHALSHPQEQRERLRSRLLEELRGADLERLMSATRPTYPGVEYVSLVKPEYNREDVDWN
ncbi:MAG: hypothetical protein IJJ33_19345 [Victivallales bacterium]|nr:hypothetical protein [Victivallales bacterium]